MMLRGRRIAFDYGEVRIGVAVSDPDSIVITPIQALINSSETLVLSISSLIAEYEPVAIVVGEPRHLSGAVSSKMESMQQFITLLRGITEIAIVTVDERLSTVSAASKLRSVGKDARASKSFIDSAAAAEILEAALNNERSKKSTDLKIGKNDE